MDTVTFATFFLERGLLGVIAFILGMGLIYMYKEKCAVEREWRESQDRNANELRKIIEKNLTHGNEIRHTLEDLADGFSAHELVTKAVDDIIGHIKSRPRNGGPAGDPR